MMSEDNFPTLIPTQSDNDRFYKNGNSKLKSLLNENVEKTSSKTDIASETVLKQEIKQEKIEIPSTVPKKEGKLTSLLSDKLTIKPKPKADIFKKGINKNRIDYDDEFPEL
jgi:hypothetical protein